MTGKMASVAIALAIVAAACVGAAAASNHIPTAPATASAWPSPASVAPSPAIPPPPPLAPDFSRVVVLVMENKEFGDVIANASAPYINALARRYGLATSSFAIAHPSLPNYLALTGGSTFGISSDCTSCSVHATNLVDQLEAAGISWKAYMGGMPSACFGGAFAGRYAKKHDPFMYYLDIAGNRARCRRIVPLSRLTADVRTGALPRFVWITPDLCQDTHDCGVATGDAYLRGLIPRLLGALGTNGALFLTWDEGSTSAGCCRLATGGRIATIVVGPTVRAGVHLASRFDHYSVLRTIELGWHLGLLRGAACGCTRSMSAFFRRGA